MGDNPGRRKEPGSLAKRAAHCTGAAREPQKEKKRARSEGVFTLILLDSLTFLLPGGTMVYYLIQGTTRGEQIMFRGERPLLLVVAQQLRQRNPHLNVRVTNRPVDLFGKCLLQKEHCG
jgi:hypothetical protein